MPAANPGATLRATTTPVVCAVNGACVTGALEIALSCTFVVASERARFADTHARLDVVAAWGLTALLPRAVGVRKAAEMSITGNFVDAAEALRLGLVNHVVPHDELLPFTRALVARHRTHRARWPRCSISTGGATASRSPTRWRSRPSTPPGRRVDPAAFGAAGAGRGGAEQVVSDDSTRAPGHRRRRRVHPRRRLLPRQLEQDRARAPA